MRLPSPSHTRKKPVSSTQAFQPIPRFDSPPISFSYIPDFFAYSSSASTFTSLSQFPVSRSEFFWKIHVRAIQAPECRWDLTYKSTGWINTLLLVSCTAESPEYFGSSPLLGFPPTAFRLTDGAMNLFPQPQAELCS